MIKLLYISSVVPDTSCGARLAIHRHLVQKQDFEVAVASYNATEAETGNNYQIPNKNKRLTRTRFARVVHNWQYVKNWFVLPGGLLDFARSFEPDVIFTVPDNIHSGLAYQLSRKLNVPLVTDYQDLFPLSRFLPDYVKPYPSIRKFLMKQFYALHASSSIAFYTSEGMQQWFGPHKNGSVLYPLGDFSLTEIPFKGHYPENRSITVLYAGNCYGAYGRMLLELARAVKNHPLIRLKIFPVGKGWSEEDILEMTEAGIYQSFMPFEQLKKEFEQADAFLTVMSFEEPEKPFVQTSFTTKWLDYAPYGKPIFVWGPDYSSAALFARKYYCGVVTSENKVNKLVKAMEETAGNRETWQALSQSAKRVAEDELNASKIHEGFVYKITEVAS